MTGDEHTDSLQTQLLAATRQADLAMKAVLHLVRQMQRSPRLAWLIGPGSESYDLLTAAAATTTGCTVEVLRAEIERDLKTEPWPQKGAAHG